MIPTWLVVLLSALFVAVGVAATALVICLMIEHIAKRFKDQR